MHEMSYIIRFISMAEESLPEEYEPSDIREISVEIGELSGVLPEYLTKYYETATAGTPLDGSKLSIREIKARAECTDCKEQYHPSRENDYRCPACGSIRSRFVQGREVNLCSVGLEQK